MAHLSSMTPVPLSSGSTPGSSLDQSLVGHHGRPASGLGRHVLTQSPGGRERCRFPTRAVLCVVPGVLGIRPFCCPERFSFLTPPPAWGLAASILTQQGWFCFLPLGLAHNRSSLTSEGWCVLAIAEHHREHGLTLTHSYNMATLEGRSGEAGLWHLCALGTWKLPTGALSLSLVLRGEQETP